MLVYMCPHAAIYVSAYCAVPRLERNTFCAAAPYDAYICVLMLLYMCPHTVQYPDWNSFCAAAPYDAKWVAIEMGGEPLETFEL
jgi:hypothetical protein